MKAIIVQNAMLVMFKLLNMLQLKRWLKERSRRSNSLHYCFCPRPCSEVWQLKIEQNKKYSSFETLFFFLAFIINKCINRYRRHIHNKVSNIREKYRYTFERL